jgi:diguanylate cyclase (GGDEF)-like protein
MPNLRRQEGMGPGKGRTRERSLAGWLAGAYTLAFAVWALFGGGSADSRELLSDIAPLPIGFAVALLAWRASTRAGDGATRRAWRLIAVAFALWWAGDVTWFFLEAVLHRAPFPSPADAGYLGFYPVLALGLLALPSAPRTRTERVKVALDALTVLLAAAMVVWYLVVEPVVHSGSDSVATALSVGYPVGDLVLLYGLVTTLLRRPGDRPLWLLVGAVSAFVVADVAYAHLSLTDSYAGGDWPDAFWMLAQCLALLAATVQARRPASLTLADGGAKPSGRVSLLPYAGIVIGYALVVAVGHDLAGASFNGLLLGAASITGVVVARQVRVAAENARLVAELHHLAEVDGLTDALNRRSLFEAGERLVRRTQRLGRPLSALMIDVDHFKAVNDTYGHAAGDDVLAAVVARTMAHVRTADLVGRYGGDELAVVMPDCPVEEAFEVAERIRCAVTATPITTRSGDISATVSIGVSGAESGASLAVVFGRADGGLYEAKRAGRGRTAVASVAG